MGALNAKRQPVYRPRATYDIESIVVYLGQVLRAPQAARTWYENMKDTVALLCDMPELGKPFDDDRLVVKGRRTYLVGSYRLFYSYSADTLIVWRVVHATRDFDDYAMIDLTD